MSASLMKLVTVKLYSLVDSSYFDVLNMSERHAHTMSEYYERLLGRESSMINILIDLWLWIIHRSEWAPIVKEAKRDEESCFYV